LTFIIIDAINSELSLSPLLWTFDERDCFEVLNVTSISGFANN
jgi:hypothetical protein